MLVQILGKIKCLGMELRSAVQIVLNQFNIQTFTLGISILGWPAQAWAFPLHHLWSERQVQARTSEQEASDERSPLWSGLSHYQKRWDLKSGQVRCYTDPKLSCCWMVVLIWNAILNLIPVEQYLLSSDDKVRISHFWVKHVFDKPGPASSDGKVSPL